MNHGMTATRLVRAQSVYSKDDSGIDQSIWRFCLGLFLLVASGVLYVWVHVQVVDIGYAINTLEHSKRTLVAGNDALRVDINLLKSPERLEKIATQELGLEPPKEKQFIYLEPRALSALADLQ